VPLRDELLTIGQRIVSFFDEKQSQPPFTVYEYLPDQEWQVRRDLRQLSRWLQLPNQNINCASISLSRLFWAALEDSGFYDELVAQEREAKSRAELDQIFEAVGEILRHPPTLPERVVAAVEQYQSTRTAVFLYQAGVLYPAYRTSTLLDDLQGQLLRPVTLLYPGRLVGDYGLSFMGKSEPAYGYRAEIVTRERPS
jgi:hypothetical protein